MVSLEELKRRREQAARAFGVVVPKIAERKEKQIVKQDIRKIKAATFRGRFGISKEGVEKVGKASRGLGEGILKATKMLAKGVIGAGEAANKYYSQQELPHKRRRKRKR